MIEPITALLGLTKVNAIQVQQNKINALRYVELVPKVKNNDFTLIEVRLDKATENPYSVTVTEKNGTLSLLTLTNYQKSVKVTDADFVFDKTKFKGISVNDLR